ncbi:MAG: PadR family transcriptional regulator [Candidatus Aminicenantes bacterium]|jgi:DNA-binding PadR family transcriptional regulator
MKLLSRQEEIVLLSIWRLEDDAYGVTIREYISRITGKYWSIGSIYVPLDRLLDKGYIQHYYKDTYNKRGGRRKRFYKISAEGMKALDEILELQKSLWEGFPKFVSE